MVTDHTRDPADDETVIDEIEDRGKPLYAVEKEIVVQEEQYVVRTSDAQSSKSWTYYIRQNDDGGWEVDKRTLHYGKRSSIERKAPESTEAVREALPVKVEN